MEKILPKDLTSYDLLKAAAVLIMIADHVGNYLFPEQLWWRAIGRIGFPIWFFLVGYAASRDIPHKLWTGAVLLLGANFVAGMGIFPLNALFTIMLIKLTIDPVMRFSLQSRLKMVAVAALMLVLVLPTYFHLCEYGTQGFITAMFGYVVRNRPVVVGGRRASAAVMGYALLSLINFLLLQQLSYSFGAVQFAVMAAGTAAVTFILYNFRPMVFPRLTAACPVALRALIQFMGRRTLEIYVFHLLVLKALGMYLQPERFTLLNWRWQR